MALKLWVLLGMRLHVGLHVRSNQTGSLPFQCIVQRRNASHPIIIIHQHAAHQSAPEQARMRCKSGRERHTVCTTRWWHVPSGLSRSNTYVRSPTSIQSPHAVFNLSNPSGVAASVTEMLSASGPCRPHTLLHHFPHFFIFLLGVESSR
jgi:hypothetical protein